jgi:glycosyltransferase involved in cell wall biosynthesis
MLPLVTIITPTYSRDTFLSKTLQYVKSQTYANIEWLVCDDSLKPSSIWTYSHNIRYDHSPQRLSIGTKRNRLIAQARGEIIVHFDDDDYYAPNYVSTMVDNLKHNDLINLRGWFVNDLRSNFFGYCDTTDKTPSHYRLSPDGCQHGRFERQENNDHLGFGFSFVYRRDCWERHPFPDVNWNEDAVFSAHAKMGGIMDQGGLCLHTIHADNTSWCYPQYQLPCFMLRQLFPEY